MIPEKENTRLSKMLSKTLRHDPAFLGIELDANGWTSVPVLLTKLSHQGQPVTMKLLEYMVTSNGKQRFAFNEDKTLIRANQGHTVEVELDYPPATPPQFLYHGTVDRFIPTILKEGLKKMERHHVHLSKDIETAVKVGQRRGKPVLLKVQAGAMHAQGHTFYVSNNGVWLTDTVAPEFIEALKESTK